MSVYESGRATITKYEVTTDGGQYNLGANAKELHFVVDGSIKLYLTQKDFDADENYWPMTGNASAGDREQFPFAANSIWMRGDNSDATVTILVVGSI